MSGVPNVSKYFGRDAVDEESRRSSGVLLKPVYISEEAAAAPSIGVIAAERGRMYAWDGLQPLGASVLIER